MNAKKGDNYLKVCFDISEDLAATYTFCLRKDL